MLKLSDLTVEYRKSPLGLDEPKPRFSWKLSATARDVMQAAYRIEVVRERDEKVVWDSGRVSSRQSVLVEYEGLPLESCTRYRWRVRVWDKSGRDVGYSQEAFWETGLMRPENWRAQWITQPDQGDITKMQPLPMFRKGFRLSGRVRKARLYASALGIYALFINGERVGEDLFAPGWTSYKTRIQYQTYDVTSMLAEGENCLGAIVADGWYRGYLAYKDQRNVFGDRLGLIAQLQISYEDGSTEVVVTDGSWKTTTEGPFRQADYYMGVHYDARMEIPGFMRPGFEDGLLKNAELLVHDVKLLTAQRDHPVRRQQILTPVQVIKTPKGETLLDMGQNMVGWIRFKVRGPEGHTVRITHGEVLDKDGNFYNDNYRLAVSEIQYTLKAGGEQSFEPDFSFFGFRYVKLENWPCEIKRHDFEGVVLHSDIEATAGFECSDERVNQLEHNILWGQKGNFVDVPTDCPQRDERLGWTGDAQIFARTACINMDSALMLSEWLKDLAADQREDGAVPHVVPQVLSPESYGGAAWGDAAVIVPWVLYTCYGDVRVLRQQYESMRAWMEYVRDQCEDYLWTTGFQFGDWLGLDAKEGDYVGATDKAYIATAYYAYCASIMERVADVLGKELDAMRYKALHRNILRSFRREYVTPNGRLAVRTQTAHVLALYFDLVESEHRQRVMRDLVELLHERGDHLSTGFVGTPYLCLALTEGGAHDVAAKVFLQTDYPSWLYPVTKGATTMWEHWDGMKPDGSFWSRDMNSFNHYAYGAIGEWMVRAVAGLDLSSPGYATLLLHPRQTEGLNFASAWQKTPYGRARCGWRVGQGKMEVSCVVPGGATAMLVLEGAQLDEVRESGRPLAKAEGVGQALQSEGDVLVSLQSGQYVFTYPAK